MEEVYGERKRCDWREDWCEVCEFCQKRIVQKNETIIAIGKAGSEDR